MKRLNLLFAAILVPSIGLMGCYEEKAKIVDDIWYGYSNKYNGWALAMDGNFSAIGNPQGYNVYNQKTGSVYIAERKDGDWLANPLKLAPVNLYNGDFFGVSVGMDSDWLIVGASHREEAFVYERYSALGNDNMWLLQDTFNGSDGVNGDDFGFSVDISGDWTIVGAPSDDNSRGVDAGAVYLFQKSGSSWVQRSKNIASDGAAGDNFGWSVAIDGDYAVVGAPFDDNQHGGNAGGIYVLRRIGTSWIQEAKKTGSSCNQGDNLGWSVAIKGNYFLAGAHYNDNQNGNNAGGAFFYVRNGSSYSEAMKLIAADGARGDYFGMSVALTDYFATIGAPYEDNVAGINAGACYIYYRSGDELLYVEKRTASDGAANDLFGFRTAMSGDYAVSSAPYDDNTVGMDAGAAYIFERTD